MSKKGLYCWFFMVKKQGEKICVYIGQMRWKRIADLSTWDDCNMQQGSWGWEQREEKDGKAVE